MKVIRWLLVIPLTTAIGAFYNLIIVGIISLFGSHFVELVFFPLQYFIIPFVVGITTLLIGSYIIPSRNEKSIKKLLAVLIIFNLVSVWILAPNTELTKDFLPTNLQILNCIFSIIGGITGFVIVKKQLKKEEKKEIFSTITQDSRVKLDNVGLKYQRDMAEKLYEDDPKLAMNIAMGLKKAPKGILAAAIYAKVCDVVEKSDDIETCMRLGNSHHNAGLSLEAQKLKLRDPYSAIEAMKQVVNARRKAFEKTLPKGKTIEDAINEEVKKIEKEIAAQKG